MCNLEIQKIQSHEKYRHSQKNYYYYIRQKGLALKNGQLNKNENRL